MQAKAQQQPPKIGKLEIKLNKARNLRGPELLHKENCYVVFRYGKTIVSSSVKYGTVAPVWEQGEQDFVIDNVPYPSSSKVAITVVYRGQERDEVLGATYPSMSKWTTGTNPREDKWSIISTKDGIYAGEINFHIHWTEHEPPKLEPPRLESPKHEPPKHEPPKLESSKLEPPKLEPPKLEPPKLEPSYSQVFKSIDPVLLGVHAGLLL